MADFAIQNHGSIYLLEPKTPEADEWVEEHLPDNAMWMGHSVAVEHRYIGNIIDGIQGDGLIVE